MDQARKQHQRNARLAAQGFISNVALEESADKLEQQQRQLANEQRASSTEDKVRSAAAQQLESAIDGLNSGLKLVSGTVDALAVRAPVEGRLTNFRLQVGESIATGKNIGRVDGAGDQLQARVQTVDGAFELLGGGAAHLSLIHI